MPRLQPYGIAVGMGLGLARLLGALDIATSRQSRGATLLDASRTPPLPMSMYFLLPRQEACHDELSAPGLDQALAAEATSAHAGRTQLLGEVGRCRHMEAMGREALRDRGGGPNVDVAWLEVDLLKPPVKRVLKLMLTVSCEQWWAQA